MACCYIAEAEEDWKALARYRKQAWDMSDSLMEAGVRAQLSQAEKLYDSSRAEADNYRLRYRVRNAVIIIVSVTVCAAALIAVLMMTQADASGDLGADVGFDGQSGRYVLPLW